MTNALPMQEFKIGQRVRPNDGQPAFIIGMICAGADGEGLRYYSPKWSGLANELTLAPEHRFNGQFPQHYRCETDAELADRHAAERAEYDAQRDGS